MIPLNEDDNEERDLYIEYVEQQDLHHVHSQEGGEAGRSQLLHTGFSVYWPSYKDAE